MLNLSVTEEAGCESVSHAGGNKPFKAVVEAAHTAQVLAQRTGDVPPLSCMRGDGLIVLSSPTLDVPFWANGRYFGASDSRTDK